MFAQVSYVRMAGSNLSAGEHGQPVLVSERVSQSVEGQEHSCRGRLTPMIHSCHAHTPSWPPTCLDSIFSMSVQCMCPAPGQWYGAPDHTVQGLWGGQGAEQSAGGPELFAVSATEQSAGATLESLIS